MEDTFVRLIGDVGFPIAVAAFVLVRLNGKVGKLADAMKDLANALTKHTDQSQIVLTDLTRRLEHLEYEDYHKKSGGC